MKKISLSGASQPRQSSPLVVTPTQEVLELFFNTGIAYHPLTIAGELPDVVASFVVMKDPQGGQAVSVRRAAPAEDPDVEISFLEHLSSFARMWIPVPYQLSCAHSVQVYLAPTGGRRGAVKAMLAIDTLEHPDTQGRFLDRKLDEGRPFRPLDREETGGFLDQPVVKEFVRRLERAGVDAAPFKLSALYEILQPYLPRIRFSRIEMPAPAGTGGAAQLSHGAEPIDVSLIVDFGNSRTTAVLVEARDKGLLSIPLALRSSSDPFTVTEEAFDSRVAFLPSPFEDTSVPLGTGEGFTLPTIARLGREALDRALETPHRYVCSLSSPKRYLWADVQNDDRWYFAAKQQGEYRTVSGRLLKYIVEEGGGALLRQDGPSAPPEPRYAPRTMMLFAFAEILTQAYSQIASMDYRRFQGKEGNPRVLRHVVLTYPSAMRAEEKEVYETLVKNAAALVAYLYNIPEDRRPNGGADEKFLFIDEAQAAQMVFLYQEVAETFSGSMEDFVKVYGDDKGKVRIASVDIGGGTTDVMVAEYGDLLAGSGTSLTIQQLFQDGVNVAGDEVCRALVEEILVPQILAQIEAPAARAAFIHLFAEGDAGHGASWRTLKAKLVPYFWLPLARCLWGVAEGFEIPGHVEGRAYGVDDVMTLFEGSTFSTAVLAEVDKFLEEVAPGFPGLRNVFFKFDRQEIERVIQDALREPLRRYSDILAQFEVDILVLAGRASALKCVRDLFLAELPVTPPRIKSMSSYRVGDWYPSKWRHNGVIRDPKSTVTAGATVLHMAAKNRLAGFMLDRIDPAPQKPIIGLYQESEPHIGRDSELFRDAETSAPIAYTSFMRLGFRNVDSPEMDASPLFEVLPSTPEAERALLRERVGLVFGRDKKGHVSIVDVKGQKNGHPFTTADFRLRLKTLTSDRYWLDTGVFRNIVRYL